MDSDASALIEDLQNQLRKDSEQYDRKNLRETALKLSMALETPGDTIQRMAYLPLVTTTCRIATKLNLFNILVGSHGPRSGEELAEETKADHDLLIRLLRYLAANSVIKEAGEDLWAANNITKALTIPSLEAGLNHTYDLVCQSGMALPGFLEETKYRNPMDPKKCAFQSAFDTTDDVFVWFPKNPEYLQNFTLWMTGQRVGRADWLDFFPFEEKIVRGFQSTDDAVLIVDVGGGMGHVIESILNKYPGLEGRCILQDLPDTISRIQLPRTGIEPMVHDFFTAQPIKGARAYHLRNIMHDWPDHHCKVILERIKAVMEKGYSKIIINEMVLPNTGANIIGTQVDLTMMVCLAAMERTEKQWRTLVDSVGLKIEKIWTDIPEVESIIEIVL